MALKDLVIDTENNVSEGVQVKDSNVVIRVTTSASATVKVQRSIDNAAGTFKDIPDVSLTINGSDEFQLSDCKPGQYLRVSADTGLTAAKVLL